MTVCRLLLSETYPLIQSVKFRLSAGEFQKHGNISAIDLNLTVDLVH